MNCTKWQIEISAFLDGALDSSTEGRVEKHLQGCANCRRFYEEQVQLNQILTRDTLELDPPSRIWNRISMELEERKTSKRTSWWNEFWSHFESPQLAYGFAALLLFGLASLFAIQVYEDFSAHPEYLAELDSFKVEVRENPFLEDLEMKNPFWDTMASNKLVTEEKNPFERYEEVMR